MEKKSKKLPHPMHQAVALLARRDHSRFELKRKLLLKGQPEPEIETVLQELQSRGYLDEQRYAESMVRHYAERGYGPLKVRYILSQNQVPGTVLHEVFETSGIDWFLMSQRAREKRFGLGKLPDDFKEKAKQMRFLMSRGFDQEQIEFAMSVSE